MSFNKNVNISGDLIVDGSSTFIGDVSFNKNVGISGDLIVDGSSTFIGHVDISGILDVSGKIRINGFQVQALKLVQDTDTGNNVDTTISSGNPNQILKIFGISGETERKEKHFYSPYDINLLNIANIVDICSNHTGVQIFTQATKNGSTSTDISLNNVATVGHLYHAIKKLHTAQTILTVTETMNAKHLNISGDLIVDGSSNSSFKGDVSFNKNVGISGNLIVDGSSSFIGDVSFNKNVDICKNLVTNQLKVNLDTSLNTLDVSSTATFKGDVSFNKKVSISGELIVGSWSHHQSGVAGAGIYVDIIHGWKGDNNAHFVGGHPDAGTLTLASRTGIGSLIPAQIKITNTGSIEVSGNTNFDNDVSFNKNVNISGDLIVDGSSTFQTISVNNDSTFSQNCFVQFPGLFLNGQEDNVFNSDSGYGNKNTALTSFKNTHRDYGGVTMFMGKKVIIDASLVISDISNETFQDVSYNISDSSNKYDQSSNSFLPPPHGPPAGDPRAEFKSHLVFLKNDNSNNKIYNISPADASGQVVEYAQWRTENNKIKDAINLLNNKLNQVINLLK